MHRIQLTQDIRPLSEFRANVASFIQQVHKTNRPLIITQNGKSAAVLIDVEDYEAMLEKLELLQDVHDAEKQIGQSKGVEHKTALARVLRSLAK